MIDYLRLVEAIDPETLPADTIAVAVVISPDVHDDVGLVSPAVHLEGLYVLTSRDQVDEALWSDAATLAEIDREAGAMLRCRAVEDLAGCTLSPQWAGAAGLPLAMAVPVPLPVSAALTPLQARRALRISGLKEAVESYVATLPEEAQETWDYALSIERDHPIITGGAAALGLTVAQVDDLFRLGATL